ncbi:hypothetical protein P3X46_019197 [Hevea brasiliensis]|uniref:Protein FAM32A-like n=1 Tax=Hevea brasiliensis TaxID=3981 RepID=A0ABQ9LKU1_HEVBR|nr:uncharacterized protein LOC110650358 [Hevea brasiliensis]KAJ9167575.1 hypothetical protein P3X46_019197 [Hevea brasiliensis]
MSAYENVVGGKLRLKGQPLDVKTVGISKTKKKKHHYHDRPRTGGNNSSSKDHGENINDETDKDDKKGQAAKYDDHITAAERRYLQQWEKIDLQRLTKMASKSHRDQIQEFNQYLANLSEHYDIPKVGPG